MQEHSLDSFLLSKRRDQTDVSADTKYKYMLFVWNGKNSGASVKSHCLTKGYALDEYLQLAQDPGLNVLFSGGVIKNKKLQRGNVFEFEDMLGKSGLKRPKQDKGHASKRDGAEPSPQQIVEAHQTIYLLKWLFPEASVQKFREHLNQTKKVLFQKFSEKFAGPEQGGNYWDKFVVLDDQTDEDQSDEDVIMKHEKGPDPVSHVRADGVVEDIDSDNEDMLQTPPAAAPRGNPKVPGIALGGLTKPPVEPVPEQKLPPAGFALKMPVPGGAPKIPALNIGQSP